MEDISLFTLIQSNTTRVYFDSDCAFIFVCYMFRSVACECEKSYKGKYKGWNFNFGNTPLDWIQELLE